jgi:hypothetical protein
MLYKSFDLIKLEFRTCIGMTLASCISPIPATSNHACDKMLLLYSIFIVVTSMLLWELAIKFSFRGIIPSQKKKEKL